MSVAGIGVGVTLFAKLISENRPGLAVTGGVTLIAFGFLLFVVSGLKSVPVKNIGVAQSFGAVSGKVYGPGVHQT